MSLTRLAMRLAAVRALTGATLAGERVYDSAIDPIDTTIAEERQPIIVITTDDHEADVEGRDLEGGAARCELVIEAAIAARVAVGEGEAAITIPHTDEGLEVALDIIEHQVLARLTRDDGGWSGVWMRLVPRITKRASRRGASSEKGLRFAARQITLTCDLVSTPTDGAAIASGTAWDAFLTLAEDDDQLGPITATIRTIVEGETLAAGRRAAHTLGIPLAEIDRIGIGPIMDMGDDPAAVETMVVTGDLSATMDEDDVDEQLPEAP